MNYLITGGCGFIGSNFILNCLASGNNIKIVDKMTYAGNVEFLKSIALNKKCNFVKGDIKDKALMKSILMSFRPDVIVNFAAESHVDNSIDSPDVFIETNIVGTFNLLQVTREYFEKVNLDMIFLHVSTDEVYGSLGDEGYFTEDTPYDPRSPYSASKAASDHLVKAFYHTYGLPIKVTNCSNNYGKWQNDEKLIPKIILNPLQKKEIPIYGDGKNIRDWIHVEDHCKAIQKVIHKGKMGETYNIGGNCEVTNVQLVNKIKKLMKYSGPSLKKYVVDRKGHDYRYAIDNTKIKSLGWEPEIKLNEGLLDTILWYQKRYSVKN